MQTITVEPLTPEAFKPFGAVVPPPTSAGRQYFEDALGSLRADAWPSLSIALIEKSANLPLVCTKMERHEFSSQTFVPMAPTAYLILVAPQNADGTGPDMTGARAFVAEGQVGITYAPNVWHHPMTVISPPAQFAITMWRDGTKGDEEFVDIEPLTVVR
ncbi:ureidoglycolate lyase [Acuticoccus kandeliae]|uniref:ureidoglycolate lyase n=1 Tax=Acuticoccus kandeliae TaxID=2073160 RepID=UPI000D3E9EBB|nr:ureidoglycolate lyase [Acuticoccus kandeliae]